MSNIETPIFHIHVKVISKRKHAGQWYALFMEPAGESVWMEQPMEPEIGSEQILYIIRHNTAERRKLDRLASRGSKEAVHQFLEATAKKYGEWCEETWMDVFQRISRN